jgi:septation ring formation regulator EzrA
MKQQCDFKRAGNVGSREAAQISGLISDLNRIVRIIDHDIAAEEENARVFDRSEATYPVLAGRLSARRDNLANTIASLERRLASLLEPAERAVVAARINPQRQPQG